MKSIISILIVVTGIIFYFTGCTTTPYTDTRTSEPVLDKNMETQTESIDPTILTGIWQGVIKADGQEPRLVFHFAQDGVSWTATMDSPDQGAEGIPVESVDLERIEKVEVVVRPQDPVAPFPYDEKEVVFPNEKAGITLAGTLTMPRQGGPFPAVILITGSGAQNRNEEIMNHRPFLVLADHLTRQGIAVLRYDDRGVGGSGGDPVTATSVDFAGDAYAAFTFLSKQQGIDSARTGIIGHSEGGIIAPMIAAAHPEVGFVVLLAGPGIIGSNLLLMQSAAILKASGAAEDRVKKANEVNRTIYEIVATESDNEKAAEEIGKILTGLGIPEDKLAAQISPLLTPWYRYFLSYDPAMSLSNTTCPVLAITGSLDVQVPADENLDAIERVLKESENDDVVTMKLEGLNHLFQHATTGLVQEYAQIEETFAPEALQIVSDWILETAKGTSDKLLL